MLIEDIEQTLKEQQFVETFKLVQCPTCEFRKTCPRTDDQAITCILEDPDSVEQKFSNNSEFKVGKSTRKLIKHIIKAIDKGINRGIVKSFPAESKFNNLVQIRKGSRKDRRAEKESKTMAYLYSSNAELMSSLVNQGLNINNAQGNNLHGADLTG